MSFIPKFLRRSRHARRLSVPTGVPYAPIPEDPTEGQSGSTSTQVDVIEGVPEIGRGIRWVHFALGFAVLLPWNAMITAMPYFLARLEGSPLRSTFASYLSASFLFSNICCLAHATYISKVSASAFRIRLSMGAMMILFIVLTISTRIPASAGAYFGFTIAIGVLLAAAGSYLQCSVVALASVFGPAAMQAVMAGQAAVGVLVSLVQLTSAALSTAAHRDNQESGGETTSAFGFFSVGIVFLMGSAMAHTWLTRLRVYSRAMEPWARGTPILSEDQASGCESMESTSSAVVSKHGLLWRVFRKNLVYEIAVAYVFLITLSVFPPITTSIQSVNTASGSPLFNPLIFNALHFFMFSIGDLLGRQLCTLPQLLTWKRHRLLLFSLARTGFVPLFLMCNIEGMPRLNSKPVINSDFLFMLILFLFGTTNGYVSSNIMMAAPNLHHNKALLREEVDTAGPVTSFCLIVGLFSGSLFSFAVRGWICGCDPFQGT